MPMIDMPLEELREYQGINPKASDFDSYWEEALEEMRKTESEMELIRADFSCNCADCYDLYFTGTGGARIHAQFLRPKKIDKPLPALLLFHGYSGNAGAWAEKLKYTAAGFAVAALDCRGQGGQSRDRSLVVGNTHRGHIIRGLGDKPESLLFRQIFLDTAQLARLVMTMNEVDENRLAAAGDSQGGGLTLACAALEPSVKKAAPLFPFLSDYKRVWEMDLGKRAYEELTDYFRRFDPAHEREEEVFLRLSYIDIQNLARRIEADVLMGTGLMDKVCPPSSQFATYNKITSNKRMIVYPDYGHEAIPDFIDRKFQFLTELVDP